MFLTIAVFVFTLLVLVISHEFGHFITAKKFGVRVLEFGFGIPPKIWGKKIGQTLVSINWLPIGGFVRLFGEDEVDDKVLKSKDSFAAQPVWQRIAIVIAGVVMNLLLAVALFYIVLAAEGFKEKIPLLTSYNFVGVNQVNESLILIGAISPDSPAAQAGINPGDRVVAINGNKLQDSKQLIDFTKQHAGEKITLTLADEQDKTRNVEVVPRVNPPAGQGPLGVELGTVEVANIYYSTPSQKIFSGFVHSYNLSAYSFNILGSLIASAFETHNLQPVSDSLSGPVGVTKLTGAILQTKAPLIPYLNFVAILSLNLAIINILPFPALDGGRLFFLAIEGIFHRKVRADIERFIHTAGMALLILLMVLITFSDIRKLLP